MNSNFMLKWPSTIPTFSKTFKVLYYSYLTFSAARIMLLPEINDLSQKKIIEPADISKSLQNVCLLSRILYLYIPNKNLGGSSDPDQASTAGFQKADELCRLLHTKLPIKLSIAHFVDFSIVLIQTRCT